MSEDPRINVNAQATEILESIAKEIKGGLKEATEVKLDFGTKDVPTFGISRRRELDGTSTLTLRMRETRCYRRGATTGDRALDNDDCEFCANRYKGAPACGLFHPYRPFACSRPAGHDGDHVACGYGVGYHPIARWKNLQA